MSDEDRTLDPAKPNTKYQFGVDDEDGDHAKRFGPDQPVEIWLLARQLVHDKPREGRILHLTLEFPNYPVARGHAEAIQAELAKLQRLVQNAQQAAHEPIPTVDDGHVHVVRFERWSRSLPFSAWCEVCMTELVPDVARWAIDRGLIAATSTPHADITARTGTIKAAIEKAVNRDPGLAP